MFRTISLLNFILWGLLASAQHPEPRVANRLSSGPVYADVMAHYRKLDREHREAKLFQYGLTDCGKPLELFVISPDAEFDPAVLRRKEHVIVLVNNGIHPGEPDGIVACMQWAEELLKGKKELPSKLVLCIIPVYNIDGLHITSPYFRSGQAGPDTVAFRGNARNLDLNRDFIKCDSENARSFTRLYQAWDPDVFVDTHVTDGADYQHVMTLIDSQRDKLSPDISRLMQDSVLPALYAGMDSAGMPMCPYVNVWGNSPEEGFNGFMEGPRYASGYSALFNAFPFVTETHMLKPYEQRIRATRVFLEILVETSSRLNSPIRDARAKARQKTALGQDVFPLRWTLDTTRTDSIRFMGYGSQSRTSTVTGLKVIQFDNTRPFTKTIPYHNTYVAGDSVRKPLAYLVPQAWREVIERLQLNGVHMERLAKDTVMELECYYIRDHKTGKTPYEAHYVHSDVQVEKRTQRIACFAGDYIIYCNQDRNRYIIETLEPTAVDAFFAWGFFDSILQQKEWFSDYLFDADAQKILDSDPVMAKTFEEKKRNEPAFAADAWAMYSWIYHRSPWYEPSHLRYPVFRLTTGLPAGQK